MPAPPLKGVGGEARVQGRNGTWRAGRRRVHRLLCAACVDRRRSAQRGAAAFLTDDMPLLAVALTVPALAAFAVAAYREARASGCGSKASTCGCGDSKNELWPQFGRVSAPASDLGGLDRE